MELADEMYTKLYGRNWNIDLNEFPWFPTIVLTIPAHFTH